MFQFDAATQAGGGGGGLAGANNGLSLDVGGTIVQLGQDVGAVGNPAILLNNREVPLGGFSLDLGIGTDPMRILIDTPNAEIFIGDPLGVGNATRSRWTDPLGRIEHFGDDQRFYQTNTGNKLMLGLDGLNGVYEMGDINNFQNFTRFLIDDFLQQVSISSNNINMLYLDQVIGNYDIGDLGGFNNATRLLIDDPAQTVKIESNLTGDDFFSIDAANGLYQMGDISGAGNGLLLSIDDANSQIALGDYNAIGNGMYFFIDDAIQRANIGNSFNLFLDLDFTSGIYRMGDLGTQFNGTMLSIDDTTQRITTRGSTQLIGTQTTFTDHAGAAAGTLLNAPTAGDPAKWIAIDDNGTTRYIPTWI